ncbi:MAG: helix-turn-helix domain-containing protein [Pseudonocardia sp.]
MLAPIGDTPDMSDNETAPVPHQGGDHIAESMDLLTVSEVAAMLRLSKMTIYRLMDKGKLPALRVGRSFRIPRDSVRALLEDSANPS